MRCVGESRRDHKEEHSRSERWRRNKKRRRISLVSSPNTTPLFSKQTHIQHFSQHEQSVFGRNNNHSCCWRMQRKHLGWREQRGDLDCVWRWRKPHWFGWRKLTGRGCCFRREADAFCNEEEAIGEESKRRVRRTRHSARRGETPSCALSA